MDFKSEFDKHFKRGAQKPLMLSFLLAILGSYIITVFFFKVGHGGEFNSIVLQPGIVFDFAINEESLRLLFLLLPFILFGVFIYIFRDSILKKSLKDASDFGLHGTSRWGKFSEVLTGNILSTKNKFSRTPLSALDVDPGIIVGKVPSKNELLIVPKNTKIDNRNTLVIGSSGSGKGQAFVFPNVINQREETLVITDPKGEIYEATHQLKRDQGYKVFLLDFVDFDPKSGYNPLDYVFDDEDARKVANTIASNAVDDAKRDFWSESAVAYFAAIILYIKVELGNKATMRDIVRFTAKAGKEEEYIDKLLAEMDPDHPAYDMFNLANMSAGNTRSGIMSTLAQQLGIFALHKISKFTAKSGFNFRDLQDHKSVLYIKVRMVDNPFKQLTATFFEQLIGQLYDIADKNHSHLLIDTTFLLDEFANIGKINSYPNVLSTCRGLGLSLNTIIQDLGQLESKSLYGPEGARTIINNHDITLYLRSKDTKTAEYFSKMAGDTTISHKQKSTSVGQKNSSKSFSEQHVKRPLLTVGELTNIPPEICYVFISGQFPLKAEKSFQYKIYGDFLFKDRKPSYMAESRNQFLKKFNLPLTPIEEVQDEFVETEINEVKKPTTMETAELEKEMALEMAQLEEEVNSSLGTVGTSKAESTATHLNETVEESSEEISEEELEFLMKDEQHEEQEAAPTINEHDDSSEITEEELAMLLQGDMAEDSEEDSINNETIPDDSEVSEIDALFSEIAAELEEIEEMEDEEDLIAQASAELIVEADNSAEDNETTTSSDEISDDLPM